MDGSAVMLANLASWLRCSRCGADLEPHNSLALACSDGHHFDVNRRGFLNGLDSSRGITGDTRQILLAREKFLERGHYESIADALASALPHRDDLAILDSGCGTGYYLHHTLATHPGSQGLALDASAAAVTLAVAATGAAGLVADVWRELAIRSERVDVITCVFAPRNPQEFARVLRRDGLLVVVTPQPGHLEELRSEGRLLGMQDDKRAQLDAALGSLFALERRTALDYPVELSPAEADLVAAMGPSGHHQLEADTSSDTRIVTVAVDVSVYSKL